MESKDLTIQHFNNFSSPTEFARIEDANVPAVFKGCVRTWPAFKLWNPSEEGLQHLKHLAGSVTVQVMATTSGANFYGDIRGHERVPIQFQSFLDLAERSKTAVGFAEGGDYEPGEDLKVRNKSSTEREESSILETPDVQLYLAQAGILSEENGASSPLCSLREDIEIPKFLKSPVSAINLWMSVNGSRSSTHYDPYHNLLCVVSGCKEVKLWPPSSTPSLYPLPIYGEASNHSGVDFANPDLTKYPRFVSAMQNYQSVTIHAGDALFLPEGWYHQVDSEAITIAVNLWWPSEISLKLGSHVDGYLLRRLLANLLDVEKEQLINDLKFPSRHISNRTVQSRKNDGETMNLQNLEVGARPLGELVPDLGERFVNRVEEGNIRESAEMDATAEALEAQKMLSERTVLEVLEVPVSSKQKSKRERRKLKLAMKAEPAPGSESSVSSSAVQLSFKSLKDSTGKTSTMAGGFRIPEREATFVSGQVDDSANSGPGAKATASPVHCLPDQKMSISKMTKLETQALSTLILSVSDLSRSTSDGDAGLGALEHDERQTDGGEDTLAQIFSSLEPSSLQRILLVMSKDFPRSLEALILHKLSPLASEILTRKFEEMDASSELHTSQEEFYAQIYSVFDDPRLAMASLVDGKEMFAAKAFNRVIDRYLGLSCSQIRN